MPITKITDAQHHADDCRKKKEAVNEACTRNETEWSLPNTQKTAQDKTKMQQATTKLCCQSSKDPHFWSNMGNMKHTERGKGLSGRVGSFGWRNDLPFPVSTSGWGGGRDSDRTHIIQPDLNGGT